MPRQTSRRGEGKRSAVFTAFLALVGCWLIASACRPVASASRCRLETDGLRLGSLSRHHVTARSFSLPARDGVYADLERREFARHKRSGPAGIVLALRVSPGHKQVSRLRLGLGLMMVISSATFRRNLTTDDDSRANFAQCKRYVASTPRRPAARARAVTSPAR
jgi:hypothetical protein